MTSRSELAEGNISGVALRLLNPGARDVSRLEFYSLDEKEMVVEVTPEGESQSPEIQLKEELAALDRRLRLQTEEMQTRVERACNETRDAVQREWERKSEEKIGEERRQLLKVSKEFQKERNRYFAAVEMEVVKLALAIAERVLHREAKLDPLLLAGVVRVALGKVAKESATILRVPLGELEMWQGVFAMDENSSLQFVEDGHLSAGECVLDTGVGTVELGVSAQLAEIEQGFFDLLQQRPA